MIGRDIGRPVDIDLMADEERPLGPSRAGGAVFSALVIILIILLVPVVLLLTSARADTSSLSLRLATAQNSLKQVATVPPEVPALRTQVDAAQKKATQLDTDLTAFSSSRIDWGTSIGSIWQQTGPQVALTSVQTDGRRVTVKGDAAALDTIVDYVDRLRATGNFMNVVIELVTSQGSPLPGPTAPPAPATPTATPNAEAPTATPSPAATATSILDGGAAPQATYTLLPTYPPLPTYTQQPAYPPDLQPTPFPPFPPYPNPEPQPFINLRIRDARFSPQHLQVGDMLKVELTIDNLGNVPFAADDRPAPGFVYNEGQAAPAGDPGRWRIGADVTSLAVLTADRYRWGLGGALQPGRSRQIIGYIKVLTPGSFTYCAGVVQEFVKWWSICEGQTTITVGAPPPAATATSPVPVASPKATACADGYEPDDTFQQAKVIGANSSLPQQRSFDHFGDADWVKFAVVPNITYTLRTSDLRNGSDTIITMYGNDGGVLYQIAQNDEDPNNSTLHPPVVGPSRIDYSFTTTQTARFGTTFYAKINSPDPSNFGCIKAYKLSLSRPTAPGVQFVSALSNADEIGGLTAAQGDDGLAWPAPVLIAGPPAPSTQPMVVAAAAPRVGFTIVLDLRGGGQ